MNRRSFLGGLTVTGASLPFSSFAAGAIADPRQKAKSVIYLFMSGGLSQYERTNLLIRSRSSVRRSRLLKTTVSFFSMKLTRLRPDQKDRVQM